MCGSFCVTARTRQVLGLSIALEVGPRELSQVLGVAPRASSRGAGDKVKSNS